MPIDWEASSGTPSPSTSVVAGAGAAGGGGNAVLEDSHGDVARPVAW
jgi:hypothetical protein